MTTIRRISFAAWVTVASIVFCAVPAASPPARKGTESATATAQARVLAEFTARADDLVRQDRFSGTILVARDGKALLSHSQGLADRQSKAPVTAETRFRLGSMNKMFTAVATLQLVEAGKLSLDETIGTYLPGYQNREMAAKVTVRHLLTHTGSTGDIFGPAFEANRAALREHSDYLKLYGARGPDQVPGAEFRYSNYGFVLLGALIEKTSGMSYYEYVQQRIFQPAGMTHTGSLPEHDEVPSRATGYMRVDGAWTPNTDTLPYRGTAAGGGYSTAEDLLRFAQALESGRLLHKTMLSQATQPQTKGVGYGYGFAVAGDDVRKWYGHGGGAPGMNAVLRIYPESGYVLVALSNLDPPAADQLMSAMGARLTVLTAGPPAFSKTPVYLRGSFNDWGLRDRLRPSGRNAYSVEVALKPGRHELKIGSEDFSQIDFGAVPGHESIETGQSFHLEPVGSNIVLAIEDPGDYIFTLNTADPLAPVVEVKVAD